MYTIQQDSANKIVIPFNGTDYDFLLIVFTYSCYESVGVFENTAGIGCDYEIVVNEVGENGTVDPENGDVKISPRSTWKGEVYGQDDNVNLFPQYAALIEQYKFQVKGNSCKVYPNLSPQIDCLPATAIVQDQDGKELARENIASGATQIITVNVQTMINVAKGDFTGVFDLSVTDQNGFYNDYTEGAIISTLSLAASPKLGSIATVRILGGLLGANAIPDSWDNFSSDAISQDDTQFNVLTILYVAADDVRIVNNVISAPDFVAPEFTSAPTATNITETSFDITAQLNENGTVYGYLLADGSTAPTVQEIIDNAQSQFSDTGTGGTLSFTGLTNETNYDVYVVAEDTAGNKQASPTLVEVLTQVTYSPEAESVFSNMPNALTTQEKNSIADLVDNIDYTTVHEIQSYNLLDVGNAVKGWKNKAIAINNGTVHIPAEGFQQQGGLDYVNTKINPQTVGLTRDNQAIHIYIKERSATATGVRIILSGNNGSIFYSFNEDDTPRMLFSINDAAGNDIVNEAVESNRVYSLIRIDSANIELFKDGVSLGVFAENSGSIPSVDLFLFIANDLSTGAYLNSKIGGIMVSDNSDVLNRATRFKTFMNSLTV